MESGQGLPAPYARLAITPPFVESGGAPTALSRWLTQAPLGTTLTQGGSWDLVAGLDAVLSLRATAHAIAPAPPRPLALSRQQSG